MILLYQTHSPYARKVLVAVHELGVADRIEVLHQETSPTLRNDRVFALNPLGKVPVLIRKGVRPLFDSQVICEFLDSLGGGKLIPENGEARWCALAWQALAQGMNESGIALRWETERRPEQFRYRPLQEGHASKLVESYDWLERELAADKGVMSILDIGKVAVATSLSWLEFRDLPSFRPQRPLLCDWFDAFSNRPSMRATRLFGATQDRLASAEAAPSSAAEAARYEPVTAGADPSSQLHAIYGSDDASDEVAAIR